MRAGRERFEPGDRVMSIVAGGGQAELAVVHERAAMPSPASSTGTRRAARPRRSAPPTTRSSRQAGLRAGERLLVHGAAGGSRHGRGAARPDAGARVTATGRDRENARAQSTRSASRRSTPRASTSTGPFDVILELVGGPNLPGNLKALATGGRIALIGIGGGAKTELNLGALMGKRARIHGSTLRARPLEDKAATTRRVERSVLRLHLRRPQRAGVATYPLDPAADGLRALQGRGQARQDDFPP